MAEQTRFTPAAELEARGDAGGSLELRPQHRAGMIRRVCSVQVSRAASRQLT